MKLERYDRNRFKWPSIGCLPFRIQIIADWSQRLRTARNSANDVWNDKKRIRFSAFGGEMISNWIGFHRLCSNYCQTFIVFSRFIIQFDCDEAMVHIFSRLEPCEGIVSMLFEIKNIVGFYDYSILCITIVMCVIKKLWQTVFFIQIHSAHEIKTCSP